MSGQGGPSAEKDAASWSLGCCAMAAFNDGQMHDPDCPEVNFWPDSPRSEGSDEESIRERWTRVLPPGNGSDQ